jgi:pimeloyl-ACP methyl ester carboxylesterase
MVAGAGRLRHLVDDRGAGGPDLGGHGGLVVCGPAGWRPFAGGQRLGSRPGDAAGVPPWHAVGADSVSALRRSCGAAGLRLVSYSRPGYGGSSRQLGRAVADCAADTLAIIEQLGAGRFYTAGWSGGGPHALACAALLGDRVLACATIAGVGPFGTAGLDFLGGMGRENQEEFGAALAGPSRLQAYLERQAQVLAEVTGEQVAAALGDLVSPVDIGALTGDYAAYLATTFRQAVAGGIWGWFDDDLAFTRPWGFALEEVGVPVVVWQGGQDRMVPFAHGQWLATHLPGARPRLLPEEGHLSIAVASFGEILDDLLASCPPVGG